MDAPEPGRARGRGRRVPARGRARGRGGRLLPIRGRGVQNGRSITDLNNFIKLHELKKQQINVIELGLQEAVKDLEFPWLIGRWKGRFVHYLEGESVPAQTRNPTKRRVIGKETEKADKGRKVARLRQSEEQVEVHIPETRKSDHYLVGESSRVQTRSLTKRRVIGEETVVKSSKRGAYKRKEARESRRPSGEHVEVHIPETNKSVHYLDGESSRVQTRSLTKRSVIGKETVVAKSAKGGADKRKRARESRRPSEEHVEVHISETSKSDHVATGNDHFVHDSEDFVNVNDKGPDGFVNGNDEGAGGFVNGNDEGPGGKEETVVVKEVSETVLDTHSAKEGPAKDPGLVSRDLIEPPKVTETEKAEAHKIQKHAKAMHVATDSDADVYDSEDFVNGNDEGPEGFVNVNDKGPDWFVNGNDEGPEGFVNGNDEGPEEKEDTVVVTEVSEAVLDTHSAEGPAKDPDLVSRDLIEPQNYKEDPLLVETEKDEAHKNLQQANAMHAMIVEKKREAEKIRAEHISAMRNAKDVSTRVEAAESVLSTAKGDLSRANDALNAAKAAKEVRSQPVGKGRSGGRKHSSKPTQSTTTPRNNQIVEEDDDVEGDDVVALAKEVVTREVAVAKAEEELMNRKDELRIAKKNASHLESTLVLAEGNVIKLVDDAKKAMAVAKDAMKRTFQVKDTVDATRDTGPPLETVAMQDDDDRRDGAFTDDTPEKTPDEENEEIFKGLDGFVNGNDEGPEGFVIGNDEGPEEEEETVVVTEVPEAVLDTLC